MIMIFILVICFILIVSKSFMNKKKRKLKSDIMILEDIFKEIYKEGTNFKYINCSYKIHRLNSLLNKSSTFPLQCYRCKFYMYCGIIYRKQFIDTLENLIKKYNEIYDNYLLEDIEKCYDELYKHKQIQKFPDLYKFKIFNGFSFGSLLVFKLDIKVKNE